MTGDHQKRQTIYAFILYICGFLLFLEWLYPLKDMAEVDNPAIFIVYAIFCFIITAISHKWWLNVLLKGFGVIIILHYLFIFYPLFSGEWFNWVYTEMGNNFSWLMEQNYDALTPMFRSLLFLILISLISYLLYYWFVIMRQVLLFIILTVVYITILDSFTAYHADMAIIRIIMIAFVTLGIAHLLREVHNEPLHFSKQNVHTHWFLPLIGLILFSVMIGLIMPKPAAQWPDPVPFLQGTHKDGRTPATMKVGYGENDTQLGGSFIQDDTPVFRAMAKEKHYWRVETKDVYTGKGWKQSKKPDYKPADKQINIQTYAKKVKTESRQTTVDFALQANFKKAVYPYGVTYIRPVLESELMADGNNGGIRKKDFAKFDTYDMRYAHPEFDVEALKAVQHTSDKKIKKQYTQLPKTLPKRVHQLAKEITDGLDNRYDKARVIEHYFGQNGFRYETTGIPVPGKNDDYVDQFLFDTKKGYCDNYSTSMVVMLRTLGIPARWVKGFTGGEMISGDMDENGYYKFEVTSANAHSWVEVYFPGSGWVPFEPTQGFTNMADFQYTTEKTPDTPEEKRKAEEKEDTKKQEKKEEKNDRLEKKEENNQTQASRKHHTNYLKWQYLAGVLMIIGILLVIMYWLRWRIRTALIYRKLRHHGSVADFKQAYLYLLKLLAYKGLKRDPSQTLRSFAGRIDSRYQTRNMEQLTYYYELMIYQEGNTKYSIRELGECWKELINRITA